VAHELDITNGVASFAARTDAWHRLGQTVGHLMTAEKLWRPRTFQGGTCDGP
jgi:hypothetical protein